ncbi:DNA repair protein [Lasiodiplodia theobromae]|uniref:DNA repair protein n=2 Tax=Lasiodiplodia TaxID=66739 RepID=A0A5N5D6H9_9PEZI|nr:Xpg i-region protein [Lasiodiplodia theobromae]KAB2573175.1 Protein MKT1 [Lasiodiplodia theobromae]KAF4543893.1 Xpg i-region protein [Lasiodiplodia theobromae]KAF9629332.1 DNA repair protein [Lasiodiplodia theobromae]KAK0664168.1 Protein MKT1 [Lasiodiplodia hormozganensis]
MISTQDDWAANLAEHSKLEELSGCSVAIDAADHLNRLLNDPQWKEPLLPALGGLPFSMKRLVLDDLQRWKNHNITPFFVFNGLDFGKRDKSFRTSDEASRVTAEAWELYNQSEAERAVSTFGEAPSTRTDDYLRNFQFLLNEAGAEFIVAPYTAWAQLAYLEKNAKHQWQAIAGPSELLFFDIERVITAWDWERGEFTWMGRRQCMSDLGNLGPDQFVDACLLAGSELLPPLPMLETRRNKPKIRSAVEMMMSLGRTGMSVCQNYQDDPKLRSMNYTDRFMRAKMSIQHHIVLTLDGKVEVLNNEHAPSDIHEFMSQRLPDEVYFYLSRGAIGSRVLTVRTSAEIIEIAPLDGGESQEYRELVRDQLIPLRNTTISLLSSSLHRFYQHKNVNLYTWFDRTNAKPITLRDTSDFRPILSNWNVKAALIQEKVKSLEGAETIGFAIQSLKDADFAAKTLTKKDTSKLLSASDELLYNSVWRFLQLREFVDAKHNLTPWGEALNAAITALNGRSELEESVFIAMELARLNILTSKNMFPSYGGPPIRGSEADKRNNLLVSRVACLGRLRHKPIGFTGPLSRHLLGYHSVISSVRSSLRDLAEVSLTTLLLNGDAERDRSDYTDLGIKLPFGIPNDCAMGIAVKSYLDELHIQSDPTTPEAKAGTKTRAARDWFPESIDFIGDLDIAFKLWDAVYAGIKKASESGLVRDGAAWDEVNKWLGPRR